MPSAITTLAKVKEALSPEDPSAFDAADARLTSLVSAVNDEFERLACRIFAEGAYTWYLDGTGISRLWLPQGPLLATPAPIVSLVAYGDNGSGGRTETLTLVTASEYLLRGLRTDNYEKAGHLDRINGYWPRGSRNIKVEATCGWATFPDKLVGDATAEACTRFNAEGAAAGIERRRIGDWEETVASSNDPSKKALTRAADHWRISDVL